MTSHSSPSRSAGGVQNFQLLLYRKALHPELFGLKGRREIKHNAYEVEGWVMAGAHLLRFKFPSAQASGFTCCELVTMQEDHLPVDGGVTSFPCAGEHEFEHDFVPERVRYITAVQTEQLSENLYKSTYDEMIDLARGTNAVIHKWSDDQGRKYLSMLDLQRAPKEVHAQSYHLMANTGLVLRTQTIFEHK